MNRMRIAARALTGLAILALASSCGWAEAARKVSAQQAVEAAVTKVQPAYPPMARQFNIEGGVDLEATITEDGSVGEVNILNGNPVLTKPAVEALKKWKFKPFMEDGKAVPAVAPFHFTFKKS